MITYAHLPAVKWNRGTELTQRRVTAIIPAFNFLMTPAAVSTLVATTALGNTIEITIGRPFQDLDDYLSFALAVSFENTAGNTIRYVLYRPAVTGFDFFYPDYEGQTIGADAVIEVWANNAETLIEGPEISFTINTATFFTSAERCFCTELSQNTLQLTLTELAEAVMPRTPAGCTDLVAWSGGFPHPSFQFITPVVDGTNVKTTSDILWPDGVDGTWTRTVKNTTFNEIDAWFAVYNATGARIIQPLITRDVHGNPTSKPALICLGASDDSADYTVTLLQQAPVFADVAAVQAATITSELIVVRDVFGSTAWYYLDSAPASPDDGGVTTIVDAAGTTFTRMQTPV